MLILAVMLLTTYSFHVGFCHMHGKGLCDGACKVLLDRTDDTPNLIRSICGCLYQLEALAYQGEKMDIQTFLLGDTTGSTEENRGMPYGNTSPKTTTEDICDLLCSIQLGGEACLCSHPNLPGK